jgi:hypothetical protein
LIVSSIKFRFILLIYPFMPVMIRNRFRKLRGVNVAFLPLHKKQTKLNFMIGEPAVLIVFNSLVYFLCRFKNY